jgi:beta-N-acetylhexosaminidase
MSAHVVAAGIDDVPATISRKVMTGVLRDDLGFRGLAVSDGLDMRGISGERGIVEAAALALNAGCDALCVGGAAAGADVFEEIVEALEARVDGDRLAEAAARVDAAAAWRTSHRRAAAISNAVGLEAARRALCVSGDVVVRDDATVMRFDTEASIAAGEVPWGMAEALAARGVRVGDGGRSLVLVVRDLHRHPEHQPAVDALLAQRPDAIVVEMGVPALRPRGAMAYVATHGAARVCAQAAAEVMRP